MTKIGTGYIDVHADLSSFWREVNREFGGRNAQFKKAGASAGAAFGQGMGGASRDINLVRSSLSGLDRDSRKATKGFSGLANSFGGAGDGARRTARAFDNFGGSFEGATASISGVRVALAALVPTMIAFSGASVAAASSLAPLVGLLAAAGNAAGAGAQGLGVFALATKGIGDALKEQTTNQLKAGGAAATQAGQQRAAARAIQSANDGVRSAVQGVDDATRSLSSAQRDQRKATDDLAPAYTQARVRLRDLKDAVTETTLSLTGANLAVRAARAALTDLLNGPDPRILADGHRAVTDSLRGEESAARSLAAAHRDLDDLLKPVDALDLADAQDAVADSIRGEEKARKHLTDIIDEQDRAAQQAGISAADWAEAVKNGLDFTIADAAGLDAAKMQQDRADAENAVGDAVRDTEHARRDLAKLEAGPSQQQIVDARQRVTDAERDVADAAQGTINARQDLAEIEKPASADEIANARHDLAEAENNVAEATKNRTRALREYQQAEKDGIAGSEEVVAAREAIADANRAVQDAVENLDNANLSATRATQALSDAHLAAAEQAAQQASATKNLNEKMDALPPAAQAFVKQLIAMKPRLDELRRTASDGFFPGATAGLKAAMGSFEEVNTVVGRTSRVLGEAAKKSGELVGSPAFGKDIVTIGSSNARVLDTLGEALRHVISALRHVMVAAGPLTEWLADVTNKWALNAASAAKAARENGKMAAFFERTRAVMERMGSIIANLAGGFLGLGKAGTKTGDEIWLSIDRVAKRFNEWANSTEGQKKLHDFFQETKDLAAALMPIFGGVAKGIAFLSLKLLPLSEALRILGPLADEATVAWIAYKLAVAAVGLATKAATAAIWLHNAAMTVQSVNMVRWRISLAAAAVQTAVMGPLLGAMSTAFWALNAAMAANPVGAVVLGLAALAAGAVYAYKHVEVFREAVDATFEWIKSHWPLLLAILTGPIGLATYAIVKNWRTVQSATETVWNAIKSFLTSIWSTISASATTSWETIKLAITAPIGLAASVVRNTLGASGLTGWLSAAWGNITDGVSTAWGKFKTLISDAVSGAASVVRNTLGAEGLTDWLGKAWGNITEGVTSFAGDIKDKIGDAFRGAANAVIGFVNTILKAINLIPGIPNIKLIDPISDDKKDQPISKGGPKGTGRLARGGAFGRTGGIVDHPITLMGEEAPTWPEIVVPLNPAYRGRAQGLAAYAARAVGVNGFAKGGMYSQKEMEDLWASQGGGDKKIAGAVGMAESGGNANAANGPYHGLWQVGPGGSFDPVENARQGIAKWRAGGGNVDARWKPWEAYTGSDGVGSDGPWRQFIGKDGGGIFSKIGDVVSGLSGILGDLASKGAGFLLDKLPGVGDLPDWLVGTGKYVLDKAGDYIKDKVAGLIGLGGGGGGTLPGSAPNGGRLQLPASFSSTHQTAGLSGYPAIDVFGRPGTTVLSPTAGKITRFSGGPNSYTGPGGPYGYSMYLDGKLGSYFLTHFGSRMVNVGQNVDYGQALGTIGDYPGDVPDHIHEGLRRAFAQGGIYGDLPFVGSYEQGGVIPRDGMAYVHRDETVTPAGQPTAHDIIEALRGMNIYIGGEKIDERVDIRLEHRNRSLNQRMQAGVIV